MSKPKIHFHNGNRNNYWVYCGHGLAYARPERNLEALPKTDKTDEVTCQHCRRKLGLTFFRSRRS